MNMTFQNPSPMRTYVLLHHYFKSLLTGVQGAHACMELVRKYQKPSTAQIMVNQWADHDKTLVFLDAGVSVHLHSFLDKLEILDPRVQLPWAPFFEDEHTLEGMLTAIAVTLPESVCKATEQVWEQATVEHCGLAYEALQEMGLDHSNRLEIFDIVQTIRGLPRAS